MKGQRKLVLENGMEFIGKGFGSEKEAICEFVFNTSVVGYQELISDPAYTGLGLIMTYPLIGNYGIIDEDYQSKLIGPSALIVKEYNDKPSNFRYTKTLKEALEENEIPGLTHIDTRMLTKVIRNNGSLKGIICDEDVSNEEALNKIKSSITDSDLVKKVSCKKRWYSRCFNPEFNVVVVDCGITYDIVRQLNDYRCNVIIVPYDTSFEKILDMKPDGLLISNGPGNPESCSEVINLVKEAQGKLPIYAIGLGHSIVALANDMDITKLASGHRGSNYPVKNLTNDKVIITVQNHGYVIKDNSSKDFEITHINLIDESIEGIKSIKDQVISVQFQNGKESLQEFIDLLKQDKEVRKDA